MVISRDAIVDSLETKRRAVGNVIHKGVLWDVTAMVKTGIMPVYFDFSCW